MSGLKISRSQPIKVAYEVELTPDDVAATLTAGASVPAAADPPPAARLTSPRSLHR